jgi:hypothetical protein
MARLRIRPIAATLVVTLLKNGYRNHSFEGVSVN